MKKAIRPAGLAFTIGLSLLLPFYTMAQLSQASFTVGGPGQEIGTAMTQTADGGYALAGYTSSYGSGNEDFYITKLSSLGVLEWTRTIGGANNDYCASIIQTSDGGYAVAGQTNSLGSGAWEGLLAKLDNLGNVTWTKTIGGTYSDFFGDIIQTADGGYILAGNADSYGPTLSNNIYVVKLNAAGTITWTQSIGGPFTGDEYGYSIIQTTDGGYAVTGMTTSYGVGSWDFYVLRLDNLGNVIWTRSIGGAGDDRSYSILQTGDGGFVVAGKTPSYGAGGTDVYVVKIDAAGTVQWTRTVGGPGEDFGNAVVETADGGFVVAGLTNSYGAGSYDVYLIKLDNTGALVWTKTIGGPGTDAARSVVRTTDGGLALTGYTNSYGAGSFDFYLLKLDASGNICATVSAGGTAGVGGQVSSGGEISTGFVTSSGGAFSSGGVIASQCFVPLSVELLHFDLECQNEKAVISWSTTSENNNDFFTVERGTDGINFMPIGTVDGAGNSGVVLNYEFLDESANPMGGNMNYYRLAQTDFNGHTEYFQSVSLNCNAGNEEILIAPNPCSEALNFQAYSAASAGATVKIFNSLGETVVHSREAFTEGLNTKQVNVASFASGCYLLQVVFDSGKVLHEQFIVQ